MDIKQIKKPLTDFSKNISKKIKVDQLIVFGSYSIGNAVEESDVDVIVVSDDFKKLGSVKRLKVLDEAAAFIRPEIIAAGFTRKELERMNKFSIIGQARDQGVYFI